MRSKRCVLGNLFLWRHVRDTPKMGTLSLRKRLFGGWVLGVVLILLTGQARAQDSTTSSMPQQGAETMEVVVRGHAKSSTFDDERGTQIVTDGQIREAHATSLADAVRQTPGLSVGQTTPGQGTIYVRGLGELSG